MAELSKIFKTNDLYEAWRNNKDIPSNVLAVVLNEDGNGVDKVVFGTNDISGQYKTYEVEKGIAPTGTINITENGENIDVKQYATANVKISTVTTTEPTLLTLKNYDEYTLPHRSSVITLSEGDYVLDGDIITYTVDIDFDRPVLANETSAIIAKQVNDILPITIQRKGASTTMFTLTVSYNIVRSSYIDLFYYVTSNNYKLCTIGIE